MDHPTAREALKKLEPLLGEWALEARSPDGEQWPGEGRARFEWHACGAHLVARTTVDLPGAPNTTSIIGCDAANGTYCQLYSDDRAVCRVGPGAVAVKAGSRAPPQANRPGRRPVGWPAGHRA